MITEEGQYRDSQDETGRGFECFIDGGVENGEGRDEGGKQDLGGENSIDLAEETPPESILSMAETWIQGPLLQVTLAQPREFVHVHLIFFLLPSSSRPSPSCLDREGERSEEETLVD